MVEVDRPGRIIGTDLHFLLEKNRSGVNATVRPENTETCFGLTLDNSPVNGAGTPVNWEERLTLYGSGLTIIRSNQCPYIDSVSQMFQGIAADVGIQSQVIELKNCQEVQESAPSPYGVLNVVCSGKLLTYHWVSEKAFRKLLEKQAQ